MRTRSVNTETDASRWLPGPGSRKKLMWVAGFPLADERGLELDRGDGCITLRMVLCH
jgi:hypothetical protein